MTDIQRARDVLARKIALDAVLTDRDVLAAIDEVLEDGARDDVTKWGNHTAFHAASGIAAAIIAADERMSA